MMVGMTGIPDLRAVNDFAIGTTCTVLEDLFAASRVGSPETGEGRRSVSLRRRVRQWWDGERGILACCPLIDVLTPFRSDRRRPSHRHLVLHCRVRHHRRHATHPPLWPGAAVAPCRATRPGARGAAG